MLALRTYPDWHTKTQLQPKLSVRQRYAEYIIIFHNFNQQHFGLTEHRLPAQQKALTVSSNLVRVLKLNPNIKQEFKFMKYLICILLSTLINCISNGQKIFDYKKREIKNDTDLLKTTTWLRAYSASRGAEELGTGYFFYSIPKKALYIITNEHVIDGYSNLVFGFNQSTRQNSFFGIDSVQERTTRFKNKDIDLVGIRIDNIPYLDLSKYSYFKVFTDNNLITKKEISSLNLFNENIISLSFPGLTTIPFPYQPYIYHVSFATPYNFKFQDTDDFCINGDLVKGCSGSPIISVQNKNGINKYVLIGTYYFNFANYQTIDSVVLDTVKSYPLMPTYDRIVIKNNEGMILPGYKVNTVLNIGRVIKSEKIIELLNND